MDQTRARELQEKLALEAAAMLSLAGSGAETAPYEQAVSLIGKAWRLTAEETSEQLALIEQEKAVMGRIENGESAEHKGNRMPVCAMAKTEKRNPTPMMATSRSSHSHRVALAFRLSG